MSNGINDKMYMGENLHSSLDFKITYVNFCGFAFDKNKNNFFIYIAGL